MGGIASSLNGIHHRLSISIHSKCLSALSTVTKYRDLVSFLKMLPDEKTPLVSYESETNSRQERTVTVADNSRSDNHVDKSAEPLPEEPLGDVSIQSVHCHTEPREDCSNKKSRNKLMWSNLFIIVSISVEVVGGYYSNSLAIGTDVAHLIADLSAIWISIIAIKLAQWPRSMRMTFGWYRAEVVGAMLSVGIIWAVTAILVICAVFRIMSKEQSEMNGLAMLITSGLGLGINLIMYKFLDHSHAHGGGDPEHGHSHGAGEKNINTWSAQIHVIGDFFQSFGVCVASGVIYAKPEYTIADPIATCICSVVVLGATGPILWDIFAIFMEAVPSAISYSSVRNTLMTVPGIQAVHSLRIWSLSSNKTAISAHLVLDPNDDSDDAQKVCQAATLSIRQHHNPIEITLQVERKQPEMDNCGQCKEKIE